MKNQNTTTAPAENTTPAAVNAAAPADTHKARIDAAATIGTSAAPALALAKITAAAPAYSGLLALLCGVAMNGHAAAITAAALKRAKVADDVAADYVRQVDNLYAAALRYADVKQNGNKKAVKSATDMMFTEWKDYLHKLTGDKVNVDPDDIGDIYAAAFTFRKYAVSMEGYQRQDGTTSARSTTAVSLRTAAAPAAFQKSVERIASAKLFGLDGIVSRQDAKTYAAAVAALRADAIKAFDTGFSLESKTA